MDDRDNTAAPAKPILRLLIAEDSEDDTLLNLRLLRGGGWDIQWERADTQENFLRRIDTEPRPDLIIADNSMPMFDAKRALELLQTRGYDIPLIIVSGTIETKKAVDLMKAGARDFLQKNDMARLLPVVQRELVEADERRQRRRIEAETRKLSNAVEQASNAIFITDRDGAIEYVNPAFEETTGYKREEVIGKNARLLKSDKHDAEYFHTLWDTILHGDTFQDVMVNRKKSGALYYEEKTISPLKDDSGNLTHFISTGTDITDKLQTQERLQFLAYYDLLTNLPNRAQLMNHLEYALLRSQRTQDGVALILINLDRFKIINDTLGREVGDDILLIQSERLKTLIKERDTLARLTGDEFAILLDDVKSPEQIPGFVEQVLAAVTQPINIGTHEFYMGASIGISLYPEDGDDSLLLLRSADSALHRAKEQGGGNYQFYSPDMSSRAFERLNMEAGLRRALENKEFLLYYQPLVDVRSGEITAMETLLRWQHPELGMVGPDRFIPLLEETGLILPVGEWILETACRQAAQWQKLFAHPIRIAVNLSGRQFHDPNLSTTVFRILRDCDLQPAMLELEITESTIMQNAQQTTDTLHALTDIGVRFSIDDFGTGYSSLAYLKRFAVDCLKIDRSFVQDIIHDPDSFSIAKSIIALAHSLNLEVVAEGIENDSQLRMLVLLNCDMLQGYYFSKPVPDSELPRLIREHRRLEFSDMQLQKGNRTLLIVDDDQNILSALKRVLRREDIDLLTASSGEEGLELLAKREVGVILSDQRMRGMSGTDFLGRVMALHPQTIRIILSGFTDQGTIMEAVNTGHVYKFISKPWEEDFLRASLREAFDAYNSRRNAHSTTGTA